MASGVDATWLAIREPFDEAALERGVIASLRAWAGRPQPDPSRPVRVVDLGSGTGVALRRAARWLEPHRIEAYAVDADPRMLDTAAQTHPHPLAPPSNAEGLASAGQRVTVKPILADALEPLGAAGGPADGSVDLVLGHAVADLFPLDCLAARTAALLRTRGLAHLALTYDGETAFEPVEDSTLEAWVARAYHRHMDRPRAADPAYGGSRAGLRLADALEAVGLEIVRSGPSVWNSRGTDRAVAQPLLDRMIRFVVDSLLELGEPPAREVQRWEASRRVLLDADDLNLRVRHLDLLARRPG